MITSIITNYNQGRFFEDAYNSLVQQTLKPTEIIVVDDASTDDSVEIIKRTLDKSNYIPTKLIIHSQNKGPSAARNTAIAEVKTEFLSFLDCDDYYLKTKLQKSLPYLERFRGQVAMVYSDFFKQEIGQPLIHEMKLSHSLEVLSKVCMPHTASVFATNIFQIIGGFNESLHGAEDYEMWRRIASNAMILHVPEPLYVYRLHGENFTIKRRQEVLDNTRRLHQNG